MTKRIQVTRESPTGRNLSFRDPVRHQSMTRAEFVRAIDNGKYPDYHTRNLNGVSTPASNPDGKKSNNLG